MSVQANSSTYSHPRENNCERYTQVEVGFPSSPEELLIPYAEQPDKPIDTIYGWVPSYVVCTVIVKHGGMVSGQLPNGIPICKAQTNEDR